jgi:hypothetical protein
MSHDPGKFTGPSKVRWRHVAKDYFQRLAAMKPGESIGFHICNKNHIERGEILVTRKYGGYVVQMPESKASSWLSRCATIST